MKKITKIIFIGILFFFLSKNLNAQVQSIKTNLYVSPFFTIGYTFNAGFNYGLDITMGLFEIQNHVPATNMGISYQIYFVNYQESIHKITAFNLIAESEVFRIGMGGAGISKKWGFRNINRSRAFGTSIDFGLSTQSYQTPWLAFKTFVPKQQWELCLNPYYISLYSYYRYKPIHLTTE